MVSIKDVARQAGVSVSTVSHVINQTRFVAPDTRANVERAIAALGYQPSSLARALKMKRTHTIGMLVTNSTNPFFAEVVHGVEEGCYRNNFSLILCNSGDEPERQEAYLVTLVQKRIDALLVMTTNNDPVFYRKLDALKDLPKVILDSEPGLDVCTIGDDSVLGGRMAAEFLISQGFENIGCLTGPEGHPRSRDRYRGYRSAMQAAGLAINPDWIQPGELNALGGYQAMGRIMQGRTRPDALFAFNDLMAMGAYRSIMEHGLAIPGDISVIGYDDLEIAGYVMPPLTTVRQPSFDLGLKAAEVLIEHLENKTYMPSVIQLNPELIIRESVGSHQPGEE